MITKLKILLLLLLYFCVQKISLGQDKQYISEIRTGLQGQFYFKNGFLSNVLVNQTGGSGRAAFLGGGIPINYIHNFHKISLSISPVFRYSKLIEPSLGNYNLNDIKWGITIDTHISVQWDLKKKSWPFKNTHLGTGLSIFNIGQSFDTYYGWSQYPSPTYNEYQATTLMSWGLHVLYERRFGNRMYLKFMVIYSNGDWIKYTPLITYSVLGNISLQYRIFGK